MWAAYTPLDAGRRTWHVTRVMRPPPPVLALAAALAQRALSRDAPRPSAGRAVAAGVIAAGFGTLSATAARQFRRRGTTVNPVDPTRASVLVTTGPNAI